MSVDVTLRGRECSSAVFHLPLCDCSQSCILPQFHYKWLLPPHPRIFVAVHRFYGQVKAGTDAKAADPKLRLAGHSWRFPSTRLHPSLAWCMSVLRIGRLARPSRRLSDDIHVNPTLGRSWPPLTGSQRSSDNRSCSRRSSCARPQRSRASSPRGWPAGVESCRRYVHAATARLEEWAWSDSPPRASQPGALWLPPSTLGEILEQPCRDETVCMQCISPRLACAYSDSSEGCIEHHIHTWCLHHSAILVCIIT